MILWALVLLCRSGYSTDPLLGSFYAMFLIIIKLYPILMLAAVLAQYTSVELMRCIDRVGCPRSLSLALAVVIRFLPDFKARAVEIMQAGKVRGLYLSPLHPLKSFELVLIPLIDRMLETSDTLSAFIITKSFEYEVKKTCYRVHHFNALNALTLIYGAALVGATIWYQLSL